MLMNALTTPVGERQLHFGRSSRRRINVRIQCRAGLQPSLFSIPSATTFHETTALTPVPCSLSPVRDPPVLSHFKLKLKLTPPRLEDGLKILTGNPRLRSYASSRMAQAIGWNCLGQAASPTRNGFLPPNDCPNGLRGEIRFPSCWGEWSETMIHCFGR